MISGFVQIDSTRFFGAIWPRIERQVDAIKSNWDKVSKCKKRGEPHPPLLIYWGYIVPDSEEKIILAVTHSPEGGPDTHWIAPELDV